VVKVIFAVQDLIAILENASNVQLHRRHVAKVIAVLMAMENLMGAILWNQNAVLMHLLLQIVVCHWIVVYLVLHVN
jgi:ferric iron reductase protein FhuF